MGSTSSSYVCNSSLYFSLRGSLSDTESLVIISSAFKEFITSTVELDSPVLGGELISTLFFYGSPLRRASVDALRTGMPGDPPLIGEDSGLISVS
jgi:hypothetical protein